MIALKDIRSLTDFQRNAKSHLRRLKNPIQPSAELDTGEAYAWLAEHDETAAVRWFNGLFEGIDCCL